MKPILLSTLINRIITYTPSSFKAKHNKEDILAHKEYLNLALNPKLSIGVSAKSIDEPDFFGREPDAEFYQAFYDIIDKNVSSSREAVLALLETYGFYAFIVVKRKFGGSIGLKVLNSIARVVDTKEVMKYTDLNFNKIKPREEYLVTRKYDGNFVVITPTSITTRGGHDLPLHELKDEVAKLAKYSKGDVNKQAVLFAEAIVNEGKLGDRYELAGLLTQIRTGTKTNWDGITFRVFDAMFVNQWEQQECDLKAKTRFTLAKIVTDTLDNRFKRTELLQSGYVDPTQLLSLCTSETKEEYEGIVVTPANSLYTFKRNKECMRYKEAKTADLRVVGFEYGKKNSGFANRVGSLVCHGFIGADEVHVKISAGLEVYQRDIDYYEEYLLDQIIEVVYNEKKGDTLILARYQRTREAGETDEYN